MQRGQPLQIPNELLNKNYILQPPSFSLRKQFEKTQGNSFIEIQPPILKFAGYELNKLNSLHFKVINKHSVPQRINIFPPTSPLFSIKLNKKGWISSGMSEDVEVILKPTQHKYLYETIKIHTESQNFIVPIHAFPVMNRNKLRDTFPKIIDFGTIQIGSSLTQVYPISSEVPLNFQYEFAIIKDHSDIKLNSLKGIVPGLGSAQIEISYQPVDMTTAVCQVQLRISQFDFQPLLIRIMGSGKNIQKKKTLKLQNLKLKESNQKVRQLRITNSSRKRAGLPNLMKSKSVNQPHTLQPQGQSKGNIRNMFEREFLDYFNTIQNLDKQKQIKFFRSPGDSLMEPSEQDKVRQQRKTYQHNYALHLKNQFLVRKALQFNADQPAPDLSNEFLYSHTPSWDTLKNKEVPARGLVLKKLMQTVSRVLIKNRVLKRLQKIKRFVKKLKKLQGKQPDSQKQKITQFGFQVAPFVWPYQYDEATSLQNPSYKIQIKPVFDDLKEIQIISESFVESLNYSREPPIVANYNFPIELHRNSKSGAQQQYYSRGLSGNQEKKQDPKSQAMLQWLGSLPTFKQPQIQPTSLLLRHPFIRQLRAFVEVDETQPEYMVQDSERLQDEVVGWRRKQQMLEVFRWKFMNSMGTDSLPYLSERMDKKLNFN